MADWLQLDPNVLPWMRRQGEAAREATQQFQFGARMAEVQKENAYRNEVLRLQKETQFLKQVSELQINQGMVEVGKVLSEIADAEDWASPQAEAKFYDVVAKNPAITRSPNFDNLASIFSNARKAKETADLARERFDTQLAIQDEITARNQSNIESRFELLNQRLEGMTRLEGLKAEHQKELAEVRGEIQMLRDQFKPLSTSSDRFDLPYSLQKEYDARLEAISNDLTLLKKPQEKQAQIKALRSEYEPYRIDRRRPASATTNQSSGTRIRNKATGKEFIYRGDPKDIPVDQYDLLP